MAYNNIFPVVENEVMNLLNAYANKRRKSGIFAEDYFLQLAASLYAWVRKESASKEVLGILSCEIFNLNEYFSDEEIQLLSEHYVSVVEYCLDGYNKNVMRSEHYAFSQPNELTAFICQSLDIPEGASVHLPFSGLCSDVIGLNNAKIDGEEITARTWALGQIRLDAHGIVADISCGDSFESLERQDKKYDYVIFNPPFNIRNCKENYSEFDAVRLAFENKLKKGGYLCCVLPISFVYGNSRQEMLRRYLVDNGYVRCVVSLPRIFAPFTNINTVVLFAQKEKAGHFALVDGREFVTKNTLGTGKQVFKYASLIDSIMSQDEKFFKVLTVESLDENYNLDPARHLLVLPETEDKLYSLKEIATVVGKSVRSKSTTQSSFLIKELSDNYINCDIVKYPIGDKRAKRRYEVSLPCIAVQVLLGKIVVGQIADNKSNCIIDAIEDTFFIQPKKDIVLEKYLLKMLTSEFVAKQVEVMCNGMVKSYLSASDFFSIRIPIPSLEKQNEAIMKDLHKGLSEGEKLLANELEEYKRDIHVKKHAVGQLLFGLNSNWELLNTIREITGGKFDENMVLGEEDNSMSVKEIFESIGDFLKSVNKAINAFTAGEEETYREETVALAPFFLEYSKTHKNTVFQIDYQPSENDFADKDIPQILFDKDDNPIGISKTEFSIRKGEPTKTVQFSNAALERIMDDICANALEYGFKGREDDDNRIKIEIQSKGGNYVVFVSNNGHAAKAGLNGEDVFKFGVTSSGHRDRHSGIGGYEIKKLMERFNGKAEFISTPSESYPVAYKLVFTKTNIVASFDLDCGMDIEDIIEEQKTLEAENRMLIEEMIAEQKAQDALLQLEVKEALEEQKAQDALLQLEVKEALEEQKAQDAMLQMEIKEALEEQKAQDALLQMEIKEALEEQKAQDALVQMEIEDAIEEQKAQDALAQIEIENMTDEEIEWNTQQVLKILRQDKNNSKEKADGKD